MAVPLVIFDAALQYRVGKLFQNLTRHMPLRSPMCTSRLVCASTQTSLSISVSVDCSRTRKATDFGAGPCGGVCDTLWFLG